MDPHAPYYPKEDALGLMGQKPITPYAARYLNSYWNRSDLGPSRLAGRREAIICLYDAAIRWVDLQLGRLVGKLRECGRWEDCILAVTADHGEEFLDHGGRYHPPSTLMEELIHVPLLLRMPGEPKKDVKATPFSLLHLAPTLLDAAGVGIPAEFCGRSAWAELRAGARHASVAISESVEGCTNPFHAGDRLGPRVLSVREARYKLVMHLNQSGDRLFDLEADPGEQAPLAASAHKPVRRRLLEIAHEHMRVTMQRDVHERVRARLYELRLEWNKPADRASPVAS